MYALDTLAIYLLVYLPDKRGEMPALEEAEMV